MNELDEIRTRTKEELSRIRGANGGHSITVAYRLCGFGAEKTSRWLENDSSFMTRNLPLFPLGARERAEFGDDRYYVGWKIILAHLDSLVSLRNPEQTINKEGLPVDWVLDMGCGRGIMLEDVAAYYGPVLNLRLEGDTLYSPDYQQKFAKRGIFLGEGIPGYGGGPSVGPHRQKGEGYSLITANCVLGYYGVEDQLSVLEFARKRLNDIGIFVAHNIFNNVEIFDARGRQIDSRSYIQEKFERMGWRIDEGETLIVARHFPTDELRLEPIPNTEILRYVNKINNCVKHLRIKES